MINCNCFVNLYVTEFYRKAKIQVEIHNLLLNIYPQRCVILTMFQFSSACDKIKYDLRQIKFESRLLLSSVGFARSLEPEPADLCLKWELNFFTCLVYLQCGL